MLSGKKRGKKRIWLSLLYCQFFLPHQGRYAFPNLILNWGEGGRNERNDYQVRGKEGGWWEEYGGREHGSGDSSFETG